MTSLMREMTTVAVECAKRPGSLSVWSQKAGKYICSDDPLFPETVAELAKTGEDDPRAINPTFKLIFLTAAGGTLLFIAICVTVTLLAGKDMPGPVEKLITGLFDLAKIGFGAVVGLLGGQSLKGKGSGQEGSS